MRNIVLKAKVKTINENEGTVEIVASTARLDRDNDTIDPKGWIFDNFQKHPILVANHMTSRDLDSIIGKIENIHVEGDAVVMTARYFINRGNKKADWAWQLVKEGIDAYSVSFIPIEYTENEKGGIDYKKQELLEVSQVVLPANPDAVSRSIPNYKKYKWMPDATKWDASRAKKDARKYALNPDGSYDMNKYKEFFVYFDKDAPQNMTSYKLPIRYLDSGEPKNVWKGIMAAMAAILGARGGVDIPETDRKKAYNYLSRLYIEHGNTPPEFKDYDNEIEILYKSGFTSVDEAREILTADNTAARKSEDEVEILKALRDLLNK